MIDALKFLANPHPSYMIFWVTKACNLSCAHCFNRCYQAVSETDLSLGEIGKISKRMAHVKYLTLAGGEPLLRRDLAAIVRTFYIHNDLHVLNLVTNGWYTDRAGTFVREVLKECPKLHMSVGVSLDGPEAVHDRFRGKKGSYNRAVQTLRQLKIMGDQTDRLTVAACGTCHAGNKDHLLSLAGHVRSDLGIPYYAGLIRGDSLPDMGLKAVSPDDFKALTDALGFEQNISLAPHYPFRHVRIAVDQIVSDIIHTSLTKHRKTLTCKAGKKGFVLTSDGEILLCEILNTRLGNVRNHGYSPYAVLNLPESLKAMDQVKKTGCHCTWECFQRLNVVFSPHIYPKLLLRTLKNMMNERL